MSLIDAGLRKAICVGGTDKCESGGTGRRARLRGVWFTPYGFKSRLSHHAELCKGSTNDSDSFCEGSNPSSAAT